HRIPNTEYMELERSNRVLNIGEDVKLWGFPEYGAGKQPEQRTGKVVSHPVVSAVQHYCVDLKINPGNSGGPLLDSSNTVIGIAHKGGPLEVHDLAVKISHIDMVI
ncbi:MAG: serine protease, partial [Alphaproteobacteria bacterium]|nr:serine protease [Alphaproteobacteria bacterium]MBU1835573.1 serine protease [Alphaproteobacteria bacterium]